MINEDTYPDYASLAGEIVSLDNDKVVHLYMMTNWCALLDDEGETPGGTRRKESAGLSRFDPSPGEAPD